MSEVYAPYHSTCPFLIMKDIAKNYLIPFQLVVQRETTSTDHNDSQFDIKSIIFGSRVVYVEIFGASL